MTVKRRIHLFVYKESHFKTCGFLSLWYFKVLIVMQRGFVQESADPIHAKFGQTQNLGWLDWLD